MTPDDQTDPFEFQRVQLRDLFAGLAMAGMLAGRQFTAIQRALIRVMAYDVADDMLAEREKRRAQ